MVPNASEYRAYPAAMDAAGDLKVRLAAFEWLREQVDAYGRVLPRSLLLKGFEFEGERVPLMSPQGIFKPRVCELPLSITTTPNSPYKDAEAGPYLVSYAYRGTDPEFADNRGLRLAMERGLPLVYLFGALPGRYIATCGLSTLSGTTGQGSTSRSPSAKPLDEMTSPGQVCLGLRRIATR